MATGLSRTARRRRGLLAALVAAGLALGGCTSESPGPGVTSSPAASSADTPSPADPASPPGGHASTLSISPAQPSQSSQPSLSSPSSPSPGDAVPDPEMTVIESAAVCTTHRESQDASYYVPPQEVFPATNGVGWSGATETLPGPDAAERSRCPGELPEEPFCEVAAPWTGMADTTFVTAARLRRAVTGQLQADPPLSATAAPDAPPTGMRVVSYAVYDVPADDPAGAQGYLSHALQTCGKARRVSLAGTTALVGTVSSTIGPPARVALLERGSRLLWVVTEGEGWKAGQRERAVTAVARHLL